MSMTRKHYQMMADAIKAGRQACGTATEYHITRWIEDVAVAHFRLDNPRFDARRFRDECGSPSEDQIARWQKQQEQQEQMAALLGRESGPSPSPGTVTRVPLPDTPEGRALFDGQTHGSRPL